MNKLLIFDLDGTLIDSLPDIVLNINIMLEKFGYKKREYKEIRNFIGHGAKQLVKDSIGKQISETRLKECLDYYNKIYTESGSPETKVYTDIKKVLKYFKNKNYKLAIITNKPQITTDNIINTYFPDIVFDSVIGQRDGLNCKPDKTATINLLNALNVLPENTYFIGDGETDFVTSKNAGVNGICVLWGYRDKDFLQGFGCEIFVETPMKLLELIK